jgi:hypothetical protein
LYNIATGSDTAIHAVRTVDLEVHYSRSGQEIGGGCELRSAWKFNDHKPRFYYAQGGRDYFRSRYLKPIAVWLMESTPTTTVRRRLNPEHYLMHDYETETLVYWDFACFTTSLSDLKHYLWYIAEGLADETDVELELFDYHAGLVRIHPSELLHSYNETVNIQSPFSIHRIVDRFGFLESDRETTFFQQGSGMLGVAGNIGFSTALHGFIILIATGDGTKGVCVGDDGLAMVVDPNILIAEIERLAPIEMSKFGIVSPLDQSYFRFLKRQWYRNQDGTFTRDYMFDFPLAPFVDGSFGSRTVPVFNNQQYECIKRTCVSAGKLLWDILSHDENTPDPDIVFIQQYLASAYRILGIPYRGFLPGFILTKGVEKPMYAGFAAPCIDFELYDPRYLDWMEFLFDNNNQRFINIPVTGFRSSIYKPMVGQEVFVEKNKAMSALEDMGYLKLENQYEAVEFLEEENRRKLRLILKRSRDDDEVQLCRATVLDEIPDKFDFLFARPQREMYSTLLNTI